MFKKLKLLFENIKENFGNADPDINIETDAEFFDSTTSDALEDCGVQKCYSKT